MAVGFLHPSDFRDLRGKGSFDKWGPQEDTLCFFLRHTAVIGSADKKDTDLVGDHTTGAVIQSTNQECSTERFRDFTKATQLLRRI